MEQKDEKGKCPRGESGGSSGSFYWIRCWDRRTKVLRRRQYYYTFMHSNGEILATSEGIHNRADRDAVVRGLLRDGIHMAIWQGPGGMEVTREFMVS